MLDPFRRKFDGFTDLFVQRLQTIKSKMIDLSKTYTFVCVIDGREVYFENRPANWMKKFANHSRNKRLCTKVCIVDKNKQIDVTAEMKH